MSVGTRRLRRAWPTAAGEIVADAAAVVAAVVALVVALVAGPGCASAIACDPDRPRGTCPDGLTCGADGVCGGADEDGRKAGEDAEGDAGREGEGDAPATGAISAQDLVDAGAGYEAVALGVLRTASLAVLGDRALLAALTDDGTAVLVSVSPDRVDAAELARDVGAALPALAIDDRGVAWVAVPDVPAQRVRLFEAAGFPADGADGVSERAPLVLGDYTDTDLRDGDRPGLANMGVFMQLAVSGHQHGLSVFSFDGGSWGRDVQLGTDEGAGPDARIAIVGAAQWVAWASNSTTFLSDGLGASWFTRQDGRELPPTLDGVGLAVLEDTPDDEAVALYAQASASGAARDLVRWRSEEDEPVPAGSALGGSFALCADAGTQRFVLARRTSVGLAIEQSGIGAATILEAVDVSFDAAPLACASGGVLGPVLLARDNDGTVWLVRRTR